MNRDMGEEKNMLGVVLFGKLLVILALPGW